MASFIHFFIAAVVLTAVLGENYNVIRPINGPEDYFKIAQAEILQKIKIAEIQNDSIDVRFRDRLAIIELQHQQVLNVTKQFVTYQSAKEQYKKCINKAQNAASDFILPARSLTKTAKIYAVNALPSRLAFCQLYNSNQTKFENCYIEHVQTAVEYVQSNLEKAQFSREQILFDMNVISQSAVQCSFYVEKVIFEPIALIFKKNNKKA